MKIYHILFLLICFGLYSCEEVVEIDLDTAEPKLVIDTTIFVLEDASESNEHTIKLSRTTGYYDTEIDWVTTAEVKIISETGEVYPFTMTENGIYTGTFQAEENIDYTLEVLYENEMYTATTQLAPSVPIDYIEQINDGGFIGEDKEVHVYFTDPASEENYYFLEFASERGNEYNVISDEFFNGNNISYSFSEDELQEGDVVKISFAGITEQTYNYLNVLLQQTGNTNGPFGTQPATVRGNITNTTNSENFPFGYFRISEAVIINYEVE